MYRPRARPSEPSAAALAHVERHLHGRPDLRVTVLLRELWDGYRYPGSYASVRRRVVALGGPRRPGPEWIDAAALLGTRPRICRPYRAKTKGNVERVIRGYSAGRPSNPQRC